MYRMISLALAFILATGLSHSGVAQQAGEHPAPDPAYEQELKSAPAQDSGDDRTPRILRLENLIEEVSAKNPSLRAARLGAEALTNRRKQVTALPDPTVMAGYRPLDLDAASDAVPNLRLQQAIPFPGKLALRGEAADYEALAEGWRADALAEELILQAKLAYYQLYHLQQHDRHVQHFQESLEIFEESAAVKYEVGSGTQQAILKAQLEKNALARERLRLADRRRTTIETLARLTNRPDLVLHAGELVVTSPQVQVDSVRAIAVALDERPEVAALETEMRLADTQVEIARKDFLPDFMLEAGFMDMGDMNHLGSRFMIGGGIMIPLQTGRRKAALEEAKVLRRQSEARYEALQTEIQTRVNELRSRLREEAKALALYENTLIPQSESTLEATLSAYTTGQIGFLDLLDAERMRFELHVEMERTYLSYLKGAAELERVIGVETLSDPLLARIHPIEPQPNHE